MFDTMTVTKVGAGLCGALLIYLMGKWGAEVLYHDAAHGDDHHAAGFAIVVDGGDDKKPVEEEVDVVALLASADAGKGEKVWGKCRACHKLDGSNGTGPALDGVVDRAVGAVDGFKYSGKLNAAADTWNAENLYKFLENPKGFAPGTTMGFAGLKKSADRINLIAYLQTTGG